MLSEQRDLHTSRLQSPAGTFGRLGSDALHAYLRSAETWAGGGSNLVVDRSASAMCQFRENQDAEISHSPIAKHEI